MLISMLKYIKVFKVQRSAPQGSPRTPAKSTAATTPGLIVRILKFWF